VVQRPNCREEGGSNSLVETQGFQDSLSFLEKRIEGKSRGGRQDYHCSQVVRDASQKRNRATGRSGEKMGQQTYPCQTQREESSQRQKKPERGCLSPGKKVWVMIFPGISNNRMEGTLY